MFFFFFFSRKNLKLRQSNKRYVCVRRRKGLGFLPSVNWGIGAVDIEEKENVNFECMRVGEHQSYDNVFHLHRVSELLPQVIPHPAPNRIPTVEMKGGNI